MSRYVITGGHHNSALVVAQALKARGHTVYWYGHRHSSRGDTHDSAEYLEVTASKIPFFDLPAGRATLSELARIPGGIYSAYRLLKKHRPHAVMTFGGYLGANTSIAAALLSLPLFLHEQTVTTGKANLLSSYFARRIYLTFPDSAVHFPPHKTVVVGLPLRPSLKSARQKTLFTRRKPTLLIMGGKQGAHVLNRFVSTHLLDLLSRYNIVHQTGTSSLTQDYERAIADAGSLGSLADSYLPLGYISEGEIGTYLKSASLYLGRSGAHICYELLYTSLRSVLVPLPSTHNREQYKNADLLASVGLGVLLPQSNLTLSNFFAAVNALPARPTAHPPVLTDATEKIVHDLENL